MVDIIDRESIDLKCEIGGEEVLAGVERLNSFGHLNSIDSLSGGDVTKYEAVLLLPYITIKQKLMLNIEQSNYKKRLHKILNEKK